MRCPPGPCRRPRSGSGRSAVDPARRSTRSPSASGSAAAAASSSTTMRTSRRSRSTGASSRSAHSVRVTPSSWRSSSNPPSSASAAPASRYRSWWNSGSRPRYSAMSVKLGLVTASVTPRPAANPLANWVLPAPRGPIRAIRSPASATSASHAASAWVAAAEVVRISSRRGRGVSACAAVVMRTGYPSRSRSARAHEPTTRGRVRRRPEGDVARRLVHAAGTAHGPREADQATRPTGAVTGRDPDRVRRPRRERQRGRVTAHDGQPRIGQDAHLPLVRGGRREQVPGERRDGSPAIAVEGQDRRTG